MSFRKKKKQHDEEELEIMDILKGLHQSGRTVIIITHDDDIAEQADLSLIHI